MMATGHYYFTFEHQYWLQLAHPNTPTILKIVQVLLQVSSSRLYNNKRENTNNLTGLTDSVGYLRPCSNWHSLTLVVVGRGATLIQVCTKSLWDKFKVCDLVHNQARQTMTISCWSIQSVWVSFTKPGGIQWLLVDRLRPGSKSTVFVFSSHHSQLQACQHHTVFCHRTEYTLASLRVSQVPVTMRNLTWQCWTLSMWQCTCTAENEFYKTR